MAVKCSMCGRKLKNQKPSWWYAGNSRCVKCTTRLPKMVDWAGRVDVQFQGRNIMRQRTPRRGRQR